MLRTVKPRNARSKRALQKREAKIVEDPKQTLFLRGTSASETLQAAVNDFYALKKPNALKFQKKNAIHPFEDASPLEFFSTKNDTSLMLFASHSKKRPHNLTFVRLFDHQILDMIELGLDIDSFLPMSAFKNSKPSIGTKPMIIFCGSPFDNVPQYRQLKSLFLDFFRGPTVPQIDVSGLRYIIQISTAEVNDNNPEPKINFRAYLLSTKHSGQSVKLPRVELEEMGPRMDFRFRRIRQPEGDMLKEALKKAKKLEQKTKKNVEMDIMGDKLGRIHTGKQDLSKLQSRKMKGLKRSKVDDGEDDAMTLVEEENTSRKRVKVA